MSVIRKVLSRRVLNGFNSIRCIGGVNEGHILRSPLPDVEIPKITIHDYVFPKCQEYSRFIATECSITGKKFTYNDIVQKSRNFGKCLRKKLKLQKGDVVAILLPNIPEYPIATFGILDAGLVVTSMNPMYTAEEISRQLKDSSVKAIITLPLLFDVVKSATLLNKQQLPILAIKTQPNEALPEGAINFEEFTNERVDIADVTSINPDDLAFLPYSSGTTGLPKGVELTHYNIISNLCQVGVPDINLIDKPTDTFQDILPVVLPMFHIYGFTVCTLNSMVNGSKIVTLPKFTPELFISTLEKHKITIIFAAPPLVLFLAAHPSVKPDHFKYCKAVSSGAAPLGALDEERFLEKSGKHVVILQGYGLTETSPVVTFTSRNLIKAFNCSGSIGKPVPNTLVKVVAVDDPTGTPLPPNEKGELLVKGPQVMRGYHNKPEETKEAFQNGWLRTGDLVYYNEDGIIYVTDRLKELIKVKGFQVAPAELEEIVRDFPNVADVAVIGVPHNTYGEVPRAYVVPKNKTEFNSQELQDYVAEKVAQYKQLKGGVELVESIPKNASGKILRRQLKLAYESKM